MTDKEFLALMRADLEKWEYIADMMDDYRLTSAIRDAKEVVSERIDHG